MPPRYYKSNQALATLLAVAVFPLIIVGAGVTSKDAGMAFPDWPTSNAHLINPPGWTENDATLWEHGHRLIGWVVGMIAIASATISWRCGGARRNLAIATLLAISVQGVLGGMRVREISTTLAMVHGIWGQACFCLACVTALVCSRTWVNRQDRLTIPSGPLLFRISLATTAALLLQLTLGAALRHFPGNTLLLVHLLWAVASSLLVGWLVLWVIGNHPRRDLIEMLGWSLGLLMVIQLMVGGVALIVTYMAIGPRGALYWVVPSIHVAVGALVLASSLLLTLSVHRMYKTDSAVASSAPDLTPVESA